MNNEKINENVTDCFGGTQFSLSPAEAFLGPQRAKTRAARTLARCQQLQKMPYKTLAA